MIEKVAGPEGRGVESALGALSIFYWQQDDLAAATPLAERALKIAEKSGVIDDRLATAQNNMATMYRDSGDWNSALALYQKALDTSLKARGPDHPDTGFFYHRIASYYYNQRDFDAARKYEQQALEIVEKSLGRENPKACLIVNTLGEEAACQGDFQTAQALFEENLSVRRKMLGPDNAYTALSMSNLATLYEFEGDFKSALPLAQEAMAKRRQYLNAFANTQSEYRQYAMQLRAHYDLDSFLSAATATNLPAAEAYAAVLDWKGATSARQRSIRAARQSLANNPEAAQLYRQLETQSRALASAYSAVVSAKETAAQHEEIQRLSQDLQTLQAKLAGISQEFRAAQAAVQCTPESLRKSLPAGTALIDIVEFARAAKAENAVKGAIDKPHAFVAFIVRPDREIEMVDLGPSARVTLAVALWRISNLPAEVKPEDKPSVEKLVNLWVKVYGPSSMPAPKLREWIWEPLAAHVEGCNTLLVAPDGALSYFPLAALPGKEDGHYLLEDFAFAAAPVPQLLPEILAKPQPIENSDQAKNILLVGDAHLQGNPGAPTQPQQAVTAQKPTDERKSLGDMPRAREEIAAISKTFGQAFPKGRIKALTGDGATEQAFRDYSPRADFIHLAVHGFYEPPRRNNAVNSAGNPGGSVFVGEAETAIAHPDLVCGLALTGADLAPEKDKDDGILTGLEVKALNLDCVDLVTLTSCQSALGLQAPAEGVLGIQHAFQVAGARSVVASLWKVPIGPTDTLMEDFYDNLWSKKMSRVEALRQAQLKLLRNGHQEVAKDLGKPVDEKKGLSPFYWAAFQLTGDWR
jgi:CHAT domain-containing protein